MKAKSPKNLSVLPHTLLYWRRKQQTLPKHRSTASRHIWRRNCWCTDRAVSKRTAFGASGTGSRCTADDADRQPAYCTYLLTPWRRVLLEKLTGLQLVKKFPAFHWNRRFITALTSVRHLSLSWASPIQPIYPHRTHWRSRLILSTHLRLGLPTGLLTSDFPTKTLYTPPLLTHTRHMPSPSHSSRFYHPHNIGWGVRLFSSSLCSLLHSPVTSPLLCPNILHVLKHPQLPFLPHVRQICFDDRTDWQRGDHHTTGSFYAFLWNNRLRWCF